MRRATRKEFSNHFAGKEKSQERIITKTPMHGVVEFYTLQGEAEVLQGVSVTIAGTVTRYLA